MTMAYTVWGRKRTTLQGNSFMGDGNAAVMVRGGNVGSEGGL